jgi:phosphoribosylaminoimidazolecarboxamide formyltransferase / IMP cyclohydrolase
MSETNNNGLRRIRRALISVSDKTGVVEFARELQRWDVEIISTGGTAKTLRDAGIEVRDVSDVTGFPEMMDGRIKTLHPRIHGALLALRKNPEHLAAMDDHQIEPIDLVVVNLYPFKETVAQEGVTVEQAIEQIDIGGPAMLRSAAKNWADVAVISSPGYYSLIAEEMRKSDGALSLETRRHMARNAFLDTGAYDWAISTYLSTAALKEEDAKVGEAVERFYAKRETEMTLPTELRQFSIIQFSKIRDLRYGENPHQLGALYTTNVGNNAESYFKKGSVTFATLESGKEMSFNNYVDADAAWQLVCDFEQTACAIIKHMNPAGVGQGVTAEEAYRKALATDPVSAFGGIVAFNCIVDEAAARSIIQIFTEVVIAPAYDEKALEVLKEKKNLRVLNAGSATRAEGLEARTISGGVLVQTRDTHRLTEQDLKIVSKREPTGEEIRDLLFAWTVSKHTKSNAIVYAREGQTVGVGAGQMSRVDSVKIGAMRARLPIAGSVLASDAFFPFRDGLDEAAKHGITAVIQPGGSVKDAEVIAAADEHGLAMVFTGIRHFRH